MTLSLKNAWEEYETGEALAATLTLTLNPELCLSRVIERVDLVSDTATRTVSLELTSGPGKHLVPVAQPLRGDLIDTLRIESSDAVSGSVVSRRDTEKFSKLLMQMVAGNASGIVDLERPFIDLATSVAAIGRQESLPILHMLQEARRSPDESDTRNAIVAFEPAVIALSKDEDFMRLFRFFRRNRLLLVPCQPTSAFFKVVYTYELGQSELAPASRLERARALFGHVPNDLRLQTPLAVKTESYHFRLRAPTNHYIRSCGVLATGAPRRGDREEVDLKPTYLIRPLPSSRVALGTQAVSLISILEMRICRPNLREECLSG